MTIVKSLPTRFQRLMLALCVMLAVALLSAVPALAQANPAQDLAGQASSGVSTAQTAIVPILGAIILFSVVVGFIFAYVKGRR